MMATDGNRPKHAVRFLQREFVNTPRSSPRESTITTMLHRFSIGIALLMLAGASTVEARCVDVVDVATELPHHFVTPKNTGVSYLYDLEIEEYFVSWAKDGYRGGPYGPFTLTRGCAPAIVQWESNEYLLLQAGCGTFCWYVLAFPLTKNTEDYIKIDRPLAFDGTRNLLAYYYAKDIIRVRSLISAYEQEIRTAYECESASGLCFEDTRFTGTSLEYTWRYNPAGQVLTVLLDEQLIGH